MTNMEEFAKGITEMAEQCPFNGCVSATFNFHARNVCGRTVTSKSDVAEGSKQKAINVFTPIIVQMLMYKLDKKKQYYGSITVTVSVVNGKFHFADFLVSERVSLGQATVLVRTERNRQKGAA